MKRHHSLILLLVFSILFSINADAQSRKHVVKAGETFYHIATEYGIKVADLQKANPSVGANYAIRPGQELTIPEGGKSVTTAPAKEEKKTEPAAKPAVKKESVATTTKTTTTTTKTTVTETEEPTPTRGYHVVKAKETIATICHDFGVTEADLKKWNDLSKGLKPGMSLKVVDL